MLTSAGPDSTGLPCALHMQVRCKPAACTTTFENLYTERGRRQYVRQVAEPLTLDDLPVAWEQIPIAHLGPVAREVSPDLASVFGAATLGITPQGWLRAWASDGLVHPAPWPQAADLLGAADAVVLSMEDLGGDRALLDRFVGWSKLLVLTEGANGAIVHIDGRRIRVPGYDVVEVDPTGAGDVFAAAFLVRLRESGDALEAARYANCVASFSVEREGTAGIPAREQVEQRLAHGRLRR